jgi:hypothetical protein
MLPTPVEYKVSKKDIDTIKQLKFEISFAGDSLTLNEFINRDYKNFDLATFLRVISSAFLPVIKHPVTKRIIYATKGKELLIEFFEADGPLKFKRLFFHQNDMKIVSHKYFSLPLAAQGKGLAKKILQASMEQYVNMALDKILVYAALEGGGYVWAKFGFVATDKDEVEKY